MKKKYNFRINLSNQSVSIEISPAIFPIPVILLAAYHFIDDAKVIVDGAEKAITVTLIPLKKAEESDLPRTKESMVRGLEELAFEFNIQLISSFLEEEESKKHAGVRETIMKAALLPQALDSSPKEQPTEKSAQPEKPCSK